MRINLKTGFFTNRCYQVKVEKTALVLYSETDQIQIAYPDLRGVSIGSRREQTSQVSIETADGIYSGFFGSAEDGEAFLSTLRHRIGCDTELSLRVR